MNVVFLSNYFNHHQKPLSDALAECCQYTFVATSPITEERLKLGWGRQTEPDYVYHYDREPQQVQELLKKAHAVIVGSAPEKLVQECIRRGQLVLRYSERPIKNGCEWKKYLPRLIRWHLRNPFWKPIYLLCASGYTAGDYAKFGLFRGKAFRWGYFPETKRYDSVEALIANKKDATILWAGRFLDWKHPDDAVRLAQRLKAAQIPFQLNIIGRGDLEEKLLQMIDAAQLHVCVHLLGTMTPEEVRAHMEQSQIFLFTSDREEGWGAVLNEAMNSGCAVVASGAIGSVPFLMKDGENGCVYRSGDVENLYEKVKALLENTNEAKRLGVNAYGTIIHGWNGKMAAKRLLCLIEELLAGNTGNQLFAEGPCSAAPRIGENWCRQGDSIH